MSGRDVINDPTGTRWYLGIRPPEAVEAQKEEDEFVYRLNPETIRVMLDRYVAATEHTDLEASAREMGVAPAYIVRLRDGLRPTRMAWGRYKAFEAATHRAREVPRKGAA